MIGGLVSVCEPQEDPSSGEEGGEEPIPCVALKAAYDILENDLCTITLDAAGGTFSDGKYTSTITILKNYPITGVEEPTKPGGIFYGWYVPDEDENPSDEPYNLNDGVTGNITLVAKYTDAITITPVEITARENDNNDSNAEKWYIGSSANGIGWLPELRFKIEAPDGVDVSQLTFNIDGENVKPVAVGDGVYLIPALDADMENYDDNWDYKNQYLTLNWTETVDSGNQTVQNGNYTDGQEYSDVCSVSATESAKGIIATYGSKTYPVTLADGEIYWKYISGVYPTTDGYSVDLGGAKA
jgi:uncharacterized repeat protein (TIGR02543 family)